MNNEPILKVNPEAKRIHGVTPSESCNLDDARDTGKLQGAEGLVDEYLSRIAALMHDGYHLCGRCYPSR